MSLTQPTTMTPNLDRPIVFLDIESTGINIATDRIVEIALLKIPPAGQSETRVYRLNPGIPIPAEASAIHGISDDDVRDCPSFREKAGEFMAYLEGCDLGGFNSNWFDVPLLVEEFLRIDQNLDMTGRRLIDVYKIFTLMEKRDLSTAYQYYCNKELDNAHSALADVEATWEVLQAQLDRYESLGRNVAELAEFSRHQEDYIDFGKRFVNRNGVPVFNFGKHKGRAVSDVLRAEPQYYDWMMKSDFMLHTKLKLKEIKLRMQASRSN